jgi:hypothetical protein
MTNKLEMPLEQFAEAVAKENERLISGPGGIMEMKQTIANKESRIEKLEAALKPFADLAYESDGEMYERLAHNLEDGAFIKARKALEEKVPLEWTEYYGQGSEPWLNKE